MPRDSTLVVHRTTAGALSVPLDDSFLGPAKSSTITSINFDPQNSNNNNRRRRFGIVGVVSWGRVAAGSVGLVAGGLVDGRWNDFTKRETGRHDKEEDNLEERNNKKIIDM
jgi:hypothetical protein